MAALCLTIVSLLFGLSGFANANNPCSSGGCLPHVHDLWRTAMSLSPTTEKVTTHQCWTIYGLFLMPLQKSDDARILVIGSGCDQPSALRANVRLWKQLFPKAELWIANKDHKCTDDLADELRESNIQTLFGDQGKTEDLAAWLKETGGDFDAVVDEGSHFNTHTMQSFQALWPALKPGGMYFMENLHMGHSTPWDDTDGKAMVADIMKAWVGQLLASDQESQTHQKVPWKAPKNVLFVFCQEEACTIGKKPGQAGVGDPDWEPTRGRQTGDQLINSPSVVSLASSVRGGTRSSGGMCTQLFDIINILAIGAASGEAVELPPLSYHVALNVSFYETPWYRAPLHKLLDVSHVIDFWKQKGVSVFHHRELQGLTTVAHQLKPWNSDLEYYSNMVKSQFEHLRKEKDVLYRLLVNPEMPVWAKGNHPLMLDAVKSIRFAPNLVHLANQIISQLRKNGPYVGVHLRVEVDYIKHPILLGFDRLHKEQCTDGMACFTHYYLPALKEANLSKSHPMYVASGVFRGEPELAHQILGQLEPFAKSLEYNARFLHDYNETLLAEQYAAIDLLVLAHSNIFFGNPTSSFSAFIVQYMKANGLKGKYIAVRPDSSTSPSWFMDWP